MRANKIIAGALVMLGFGGVLGSASGCGANRASKSRTVEPEPAKDTIESPVIVPDTVRIRVMYGVPIVPYELKQAADSSDEAVTPVE